MHIFLFSVIDVKKITDLGINFAFNLKFKYWEILFVPNPNSKSEILSIYRDLPLTALDPPLSTFSSLSPALILVRARPWIFEYTEFDQIFG